MPSDPHQLKAIESMIAGLTRSGMTYQAIARETNLAPGTVWRMGNYRFVGGMPRYQSVLAVERLYEKRVGPSPLRR